MTRSANSSSGVQHNTMVLSPISMSLGGSSSITTDSSMDQSMNGRHSHQPQHQHRHRHINGNGNGSGSGYDIQQQKRKQQQQEKKKKKKEKMKNDMNESDSVYCESSSSSTLSLSMSGVSSSLSMDNKSHHFTDGDGSSTTVDILRVQLSQKDLAINALKNDHKRTIATLHNSLNAANNDRSILQKRIEQQDITHQKELHAARDSTKEALERVRHRQNEIELRTPTLNERVSDIKEEIGDLETSLISEEKYKKEKHVLQRSVDEHRERARSAVAEMQQCISDNRANETAAQAKEKALKREVDTLREVVERLERELADTRDNVVSGNYKVNTYDELHSRCERLASEAMEERQAATLSQAAQAEREKECDDLRRQLADALQARELLLLDKSHLNKEVEALSTRGHRLEEQLATQQGKVGEAREAQERFYEQLLASRDKHKSEYETKLQENIDALRKRTDAELESLRSNTSALHEREKRNLMDMRDSAIEEKDRLAVSERELRARYDDLLTEFRKLQMSSDNKVCDLSNQMKMKAFELQRSELLFEEAAANSKRSMLELEKTRSKLEMTTHDYRVMEATLRSNVAELTTAIDDKTDRLAVYEQLEQELDNVVAQAGAESGDDHRAEELLLSYGVNSSGICTTSKRRLKHSVQLARRVVELQRLNRSLEGNLEAEKSRTKQLAEEVKGVGELLQQTQQPYHYLVDNIRTKDAELQICRSQIAAYELDIQNLTRTRNDLLKVKNAMSADLEHLLGQRDELHDLKKFAYDARISDHYGCDKNINGVDIEENIYDGKLLELTRNVPQWARSLNISATR